MPSPTPSRGFRADIEGLRAVAIGSVLLFHAGAPFLPGGFVGVDIFFVISGFLITGVLLRELEDTGRIALLRFWGRRAKRLLPASALVLCATVVGSWLLLPSTSWRSIGADVAASSAYLVNWRFAGEAVDYNAEGAGVSPVLHFWSLAVEEQFYIIWPLLLVVLGAVVLRRVPSSRHRLATALALAALAIPSLLWSLSYSGLNPDGAFFVTTTRIWELGIGAGVAVGAAHWRRIPPLGAALLGWCGLLAIVVSATLFSEDLPWPGGLALVPVLGTAAIIISASRPETARGAARLLSWRPLLWIGALSYSWYLWHWPILVFAETQFGELRFRWALVAVLVSGLLAWVSLRFVENPIRRARPLSENPKLALSAGISFTLIGILAGTALILAVPQQTAATQGPGATVLRTMPAEDRAGLADIDTSSSLSPAPADATLDLPDIPSRCTVKPSDDAVEVCEFGDPNSETTIALVGDSKIQQMHSAFESLAESHGWRLTTYYKSACAFANPQYDPEDADQERCARWNTAATSQLLAAEPDLIVTTGRGVIGGRGPDGGVEPGASMIADSWSRLMDAGIPVVPLLDNPAPPFEVYECVAANPELLSECSFDRDQAIADSGAPFQLAAIEMTQLTDVIDLTESVCPVAERCPAVIGDVLLFRQGSHLTDTYVSTLRQELDEQLTPIVDRITGTI